MRRETAQREQPGKRYCYSRHYRNRKHRQRDQLLTTKRAVTNVTAPARWGSSGQRGSPLRPHDSTKRKGDQSVYTTVRPIHQRRGICVNDFTATGFSAAVGTRKRRAYSRIERSQRGRTDQRSMSVSWLVRSEPSKDSGRKSSNVYRSDVDGASRGTDQTLTDEG